MFCAQFIRRFFLKERIHSQLRCAGDRLSHYGRRNLKVRTTLNWGNREISNRIYRDKGRKQKVQRKRQITRAIPTMKHGSDRRFSITFPNARCLQAANAAARGAMWPRLHVPVWPEAPGPPRCAGAAPERDPRPPQRSPRPCPRQHGSVTQLAPAGLLLQWGRAEQPRTGGARFSWESLRTQGTEES